MKTILADALLLCGFLFFIGLMACFAYLYECSATPFDKRSESCHVAMTIGK